MSKRHEIDGEDTSPPIQNHLSFIEAIAYSAVIGFIALLAAGFFDGMVPWK